MTYSSDGLHLTEHFEGCRLSAYQDDGGVWTIGYGHTYKVIPGMTCTQAQAESWLMEDVARAANAVNIMVKVKLSQPEFDALTDFVFNVGIGNFRDSTCLRVLNQGNYWLAADEFLKWHFVHGKPIAGLLLRRKAEQQEFKA